MGHSLSTRPTTLRRLLPTPSPSEPHEADASRQGGAKKLRGKEDSTNLLPCGAGGGPESPHDSTLIGSVRSNYVPAQFTLD